MKFILPLLTTLLATMGTCNADMDTRTLRRGGRSSSSSSQDIQSLNLNIINQAFQQPFSGFFVMVHNDKVPPLYVRGQPASPELARLAEDGTPGQLVEKYENMDGVFAAFAFTEGAPYFLGEMVSIPVEVPDGYYVTIATMAIHTNDCFVSINGQKLYSGQVLDLPGLDAGSEVNNEECNSIPGPACNEFSEDNVESGGGEGYVHVHRGFFGIGGDLSEMGYDWRNPMMRVVVSN